MTTKRPVAALLGRTILFKSLAERDRVLIARQMVPAHFAAEQLIFARGDPPNDMYLVVKGRRGGSAMAAAAVNSIAHERE